MRDSANRHRRHVEFEVGDLVWLKLQPYRQHSVARPQSAKLARRFYGPFEVMQRIGPVAYRLRLPEGSKIHNVFHISLLKEFVAGDVDASAALPAEFMGDRPVAHPIKVLNRKVLWHDGRPLEHVLVRWSDGSDSPTWEPWASLKSRFPSLLLEDKEPANGEGVDTSIITPTAMTASTEITASGPELEREQDLPDDERESRGTELVEVQQPEKPEGRPKRQSRPPDRFGDYVAK